MTRTEDAMRDGTWQAEDGMLVRELLDRYSEEIVPLKKTSKFHHTNLAALNKGLGEILLQKLDAGHVVDYVKTRRKSKTRLGKPYSSSTIRKEINTLNHVLDTGIALWDAPMAVNPVAKAKAILRRTDALNESKPRARRLADGEERKLLDALVDAVQPRLLVMLTLATARRLQELLAVDADKISVRGGASYLKVADSKTGKAFTVPISNEAAIMLESIEPEYFTIRSDTVSQAFSRAVKRAGLKDLRLTDLRHEALSRLFEQGFNVPEVMAISGHSTPDVLLKVYAQVEGEKVGEKLRAG